MCLGGHLAYRCALDPRVISTVCYFATDIHSGSLGAGGDDSLARTGEIKGELVMVRACSTPTTSYYSFDQARIEKTDLRPDLWQKRQPRAARRPRSHPQEPAQ